MDIVPHAEVGSRGETCMRVDLSHLLLCLLHGSPPCGDRLLVVGKTYDDEIEVGLAEELSPVGEEPVEEPAVLDVATHIALALIPQRTRESYTLEGATMAL